MGQHDHQRSGVVRHGRASGEATGSADFAAVDEQLVGIIHLEGRADGERVAERGVHREADTVPPIAGIGSVSPRAPPRDISLEPHVRVVCPR